MTQQIITGFAISLFGLFLTYILGITPEPLARQTVPKQILLVLCTYALVFLIIVIINIIRAPFILDKEQSELVIELRKKLRAAEDQMQETNRQLESVTMNHRNLRANLVYRRIRRAFTSTDRYVGEDEDGAITLLAEFKNEADVHASDAMVRASIFFEDQSGVRVREVPDGAWLKERGRSTKFRLNDAKELVIAFQSKDGIKILGTSKPSLLRGVRFEQYDLPHGEYNVVVHLVTAKPSILLGEYRFKLVTHPELHLEPV